MEIACGRDTGRSYPRSFRGGELDRAGTRLLGVVGGREYRYTYPNAIPLNTWPRISLLEMAALLKPNRCAISCAKKCRLWRSHIRATCCSASRPNWQTSSG